jgi:hypothetical protein
MQHDIIRKGDVTTEKVILWGNSNKIKRLPIDTSVRVPTLARGHMRARQLHVRL